jgi:hypothetical protein
MTKDILRYDRMVDRAMRGVVREALSYVARHGLPGSHHFYITFRTAAPGVLLPDFLRARYPDHMTIVLEHQFGDLTVSEEAMAVTLSFQNRPERLTIPFAAIADFADPSVKFRLPFQDQAAATSDPRRADPGESPREAKPATLVAVPSPADGKSAALRSGAKPPPGTPSPDQGSADKKSAGKKAGEKKPGEVVTLDTFRKK